jgi:cell division protease FtsH
MIVKYGMDKDLGTITYLENNKNEYSMFRGYSEKTAQIIDEKIKQYMSDCYEKSKKLIIQHKELIEKLSVVLLDKEYLSKEEFESMITNFSKVKKPVAKKIVKKA